MSVEHSDGGQHPVNNPSAPAETTPALHIVQGDSGVASLTEGATPVGEGKHPDLSTAIPAKHETSRAKRWVRTVGENLIWGYGVPYAAGLGAIPLTEALVDGRNDALVTTFSGALYVTMAVSLAAVGERIVRRQTSVGHSPSVGAMVGYEHATRKTTDEEKITRRTAIGYLAEQIIEELPILAPAIGIAAEHGLKPAMIFLGGSAVPTIATRVTQFNTMRRYSGEPIFFKKTRERLRTQERVRKAKEIFHKDRHSPTA